ncbi:hypothetical protein Cma02nite_02060 [Cellulomonas marina]|nr:hypothetical protein Cma02nite_02060 [Cellulomonas marina]
MPSPSRSSLGTSALPAAWVRDIDRRSGWCTTINPGTRALLPTVPHHLGDGASGRRRIVAPATDTRGFPAVRAMG